jgi:hypothetical protein
LASESEANATIGTERLPRSSVVFWSLMDRLRVPDEKALALIDRPGGLTRAGKRPRFSLTTEQGRRLSYLLEIEANLLRSGQDPGGWIARKSASRPFGGRSPLDYMTAHGLPGFAEALKFLNRQALRRSASAQ